jgi:hypothetical protein
MNQKHISIHGHFYQPPRIDPRSGVIPQEKGAQPYENWTARIHDECYLPNAQMKNFEKISFNFGATLTDWMKKNKPDTLAEIIRQENGVYTRYGVSNAMAQPYIHAIMPLVNRREKETLVRWGIADYTHYFGHAPQGMWLPETAVDLETLDVLAAHGIQFTILAPWQAKDPALDITRPYRVKTPTGREITVFFYNSFLSSELSFNTSASMEADVFVKDWLIPQVNFMAREGEQFFLAASDGELYGHHMKEREKFLSYLIQRELPRDGFTPSFPALWLQAHPVTEFTEINEKTSWSCHHGIARWKDVCGDAPSAYWKAPLREFLDQLADAIDAKYVLLASNYVDDPWALRETYIDFLLGRKPLPELIQAMSRKTLSKSEMQKMQWLLESQFERLRMHSSDAWFFFDFDSIEPLNGLRYAAHATQCMLRASGEDISQPLCAILAQAKDNQSGLTGDSAFRNVLAEYASSSIIY